MTNPDVIGVFLIFTLIGILTHLVKGHGMMMDPPGRSSMWRYGYPTEVNNYDNGLNCGGFWVRCIQNCTYIICAHVLRVVTRLRQFSCISVVVIMPINCYGHFKPNGKMESGCSIHMCVMKYIRVYLYRSYLSSLSIRVCFRVYLLTESCSPFHHVTSLW